MASHRAEFGWDSAEPTWSASAPVTPACSTSFCSTYAPRKPGNAHREQHEGREEEEEPERDRTSDESACGLAIALPEPDPEVDHEVMPVLLQVATGPGAAASR